MISIVYLKERDKVFDFSKEPVVTAWGQIYRTQNSGIYSILDLEGKTVAVMEKDNNAKLFDTEAVTHLFCNWNQGLNICRITRSHFTTERAPLIINHNTTTICFKSGR